jgi:hypothetical protein
MLKKARLLTHPALSAPRRALSRARAFPFPIPPLRGGAKAALNCAHRTSTVSPCAFCEQGGHLAAPSSSFSSRALREHGDRPSYPIFFFSILLGVGSGSRQACLFREAQHEVHGLNGLACGAFHKIIERGHCNN